MDTTVTGFVGRGVEETYSVSKPMRLVGQKSSAQCVDWPPDACQQAYVLLFLPYDNRNY
jgi:hypothetical protein